LVGIITNRDLRFEKEMGRPVTEVMTKENIMTAEEGTNLVRAEEILRRHKIEKLPVVNKDNVLVGLITFKDIIKVKLKPNACKDELGRLRVAAAVGVTADVEDRIAALVKAGVDAVTIDTAHGHSRGVIEVLKKVKSRFTGFDV